MAQTLIDIDDALLAEAGGRAWHEDEEATRVNAALAEVGALVRRREHLEFRTPGRRAT